MKKFFIYFLLIALLPVFASCNGKQKGSSEDSETTVEETETQGNDVSGYFAASDSPARATEPAGAVEASMAIDENLPTVIDFSAVWCGPCRRMKPVFEELKEVYDGHVNFVTVDIDENPGLAGKYGVEAVPTFVFLDKNGKEKSRQVGAIPRAELEQEINNLMK